MQRRQSNFSFLQPQSRNKAVRNLNSTGANSTHHNSRTCAQEVVSRIVWKSAAVLRIVEKVMLPGEKANPTKPDHSKLITGLKTDNMVKLTPSIHHLVSSMHRLPSFNSYSVRCSLRRLPCVYYLQPSSDPNCGTYEARTVLSTVLHQAVQTAHHSCLMFTHV